MHPEALISYLDQYPCTKMPVTALYIIAKNGVNHEFLWHKTLPKIRLFSKFSHSKLDTFNVYFYEFNEHIYIHLTITIISIKNIALTQYTLSWLPVVVTYPPTTSDITEMSQ